MSRISRHIGQLESRDRRGPRAWRALLGTARDVGVKRTMTLEIGGAKFKIVSDADQSHLVELAGIVNERMQKLTDAGARSASSAQLLALVSLGLADELKTAKHKLSEAARISRSAIARAIARIEEELTADDARQTGQAEQDGQS